jgi:alpha-ketoglutarate-dependent taurine dioxygenase
MLAKDIYDSWCTEYTVTLAEFLAEEDQTWRDRLVRRGLLILKSLPPTLTDAEFHSICKKFGKLWNINDYRRGSGRFDVTLNREGLDFPTSYFKTQNNFWKDNEMKYHADMAHIGEKSFPARALYMVRTTQNGSGDTYWLNLELAYNQFTEEEKTYYNDVDIYQHFMYAPGENIVKFPFLKTNPFTGNVSPRMNCYGRDKTWIHHVDKGGETIEDLGKFMENIYSLCETKKNALYRHHWENGDILIYDNWNSVHRRDPVSFQPDEPDRLLKRLTFNIAQ